FIGHKKLWASLQPGKHVIFNFSDTKLVDHSFMEQLHHFEEDYHHQGGQVSVVGLEKFNPFSNHPLAARKFSSTKATTFEIKLTVRQVELREFAALHQYSFAPQKILAAPKYKGFPIEKGHDLSFEENLLTQYTDHGKVEVSDLQLREGAGHASTERIITTVQLSETGLTIPNFALEPEGLWSKLFEHTAGKDIDFSAYPDFSKKYYLRGDSEAAVTSFLKEPLVRFLENREGMHIESNKNCLIFYKKKSELTPVEIEYVVKFAKEFVEHAQ
ncbi:MAG: hypothetical protein ACKOE6_04445, partial [Flammeovirgaceae bacterium]